jgi:hypothetical protein
MFRVPSQKSKQTRVPLLNRKGGQKKMHDGTTIMNLENLVEHVTEICEAQTRLHELELLTEFLTKNPNIKKHELGEYILNRVKEIEGNS